MIRGIAETVENTQWLRYGLTRRYLFLGDCFQINRFWHVRVHTAREATVFLRLRSVSVHRDYRYGVRRSVAIQNLLPPMLLDVSYASCSFSRYRFSFL